MKVQTVTVEIHEKRAHPTEMGHYDAKVEYTAQVGEWDDPNILVANLQFIARQQVADECDRWVAEIERRRQVEGAKSGLDWIIDRAKGDNVYDSDAEETAKHLSVLSAAEQANYRAKLETAQQGFVASLRNRLNNYIQKAEQGNLSTRSLEYFHDYVNRLPEDEQQGYLDRMTAALEPKAIAEPAPQTEFAVTIDEEDQPF